MAVITNPRWIPRAIPVRSPAPKAWDITGSKAKSVPSPKLAVRKKNRLPNATAARSRAETCPTITVSTAPIITTPTWTAATGMARRIREAKSAFTGIIWRTTRMGTQESGVALDMKRTSTEPKAPTRSEKDNTFALGGA